MPASAPLIPLRLDTSIVLETSQDFGGIGRASRCGLSCKCSETPSARLIRPDEFYELDPLRGASKDLNAVSPDGWPFGKQPFVEKTFKTLAGGIRRRASTPILFRCAPRKCRARSLICSRIFL